MVIVPDRAAPPLVATLYATVPLPVPDAPLVMVIHASFDVAVHEHAAPAVTPTLPVPPALPTLWLLVLIA